MTQAGGTPVEETSSRFAITTRRPVAILMVVMAVCVFGWVSYQRLSLDLMPDIAYPTLTVRTEYPGTAPEEIENLISRRLERELGVVPHLVSISSISKAGLSDLILEFEWDTDMNTASQDIREKVDRTWLPEDAEKPLLLRYDPSLDPIMRIGLYGEQGLYALRELAEHEIRRELESIPGVAAVKVKGGLEEEIHVALNESQLALMGLDIAQINARLAQANVNLPGGRLREGQTEYLVRTLNEFQSLGEIADLIVSPQGGPDVRVRDIGVVSRSHRDREIITRVNGRESVELEVYKEADANIVAVAALVKNRIFGLPAQRAYVEEFEREEEEKQRKAEEGEGEEEEEGAEEPEEDEGLKEKKQEAARQTVEHLRMTDFIDYRLPEGAELEILSDQAVFIVDSIQEVQKSALIGGTMAILILFVFLRNIVHTLIIGVTIPVSIVATFAPMYLFDVSLNIMSLGGLALGIGMLVDNSIVVLESIFRCRQEGDDLIRATVRGTGEVGSAVFASTLTTIAVFFPIVFVEGIAGQVFGDMSLTVVFSLLASLAVALYFIPMLASRQLRADGGVLSQIRDSDFLRLRALQRMREAASAEETPFPRRAASVVSAVPLLLFETAQRMVLAVAALAAAVLKAAFILLFEPVWVFVKLIERAWTGPETTYHSQVNAWAASDRLTVRRLPPWVWIAVLILLAGWQFVPESAHEPIKGIVEGFDPMWVTATLAALLALALAFTIDGFERVWPGILGYAAGADLTSDMQPICRWLSTGMREYCRWVGRSSHVVWKIGKVLLFPLVLVLIVLRAVARAFLDAGRALVAGARRYPAWIGRPQRLVSKIGRALLSPLALIYLVIRSIVVFGKVVLFLVIFVYLVFRFVFQSMVRLIGIALHTSLLVLALLVLVFAALAGLILAIPVLPILYVFGQGFELVQQAYPRALRFALRQRLAVMAVAAASFWACWTALVPELGTELIPQVHQGEFNLDVALPVGTPLSRTAQVVRSLEEVILEQPEVQRASSTVGTDMTATASSDEGEHTAQITIKMNSGSDAGTEERLIARLREEMRDLAEVVTEISYPALFSFKTPIEVEIRGHDVSELRRLSQEAMSRMSAIPGLADVKSTLQVGNPELQVVYDRDRLAGYGLDLRTVAELVRNKVQGRVATDYRRQERNIDVLVRLREGDRLGVGELSRLNVNPRGAVPITLASVATLSIDEGPSEIRRIDQQRAALITANIRGVDLGTASKQIDAALQNMDYPSGFTYLISGQNKEMETSLKSMLFALGLAIFLVYIVMASQFESLIHPFVIMFTVPLALIGVVVVLYIGQIPLSVVVFIGLIMLAGIVVNNAIVLVDYINTLRRGGMAKTEAIVQAGSVRLRPILMTTLTTVLGLLPMALGMGEGAEIRTPMAITVIAGLTSATFLTLIVIPTVYSVVDRGE